MTIINLCVERGCARTGLVASIPIISDIRVALAVPSRLVIHVLHPSAQQFWHPIPTESDKHYNNYFQSTT